MAAVLERRGESAVTSSDSFASNFKRAVASMLHRREDDCHPQPGVNLCEKPGISSATVTWIIVGVVL